MITTNLSRDNEKSSSTIPGAKQEAYSGDQKAVLKPSSSRHWSSAGFRNPRIVRVSRTFGGKDRHSKVCTVRGLRDRRIRLSVPTAIELYDLQDRLGLSQPSKVIDWLIDNTKTDIDKLPPLQFPQGSLLSSSSTQFLNHHHHLNDQDQFSHKLFGMSPYYNNNINLYNQSSSSSSPSLSLSSHHQFGLGQFSFVDGSSSSTVFNNNNNNNNNNPQLYYPHQYNHDQTAERSSSSSSSSRMIVNQHHQIQLLTSVGTNNPPHHHHQNASSSQHSHILFPNNFSLMSSLQNSSTNNIASETTISTTPTNNNSLFKSFPAIFNPGFLSFGNRTEKDDQT